VRQSEHIDVTVRSWRKLLTMDRFFGPLVEQEMRNAADNVVLSDTFQDCGHSISLEQPEKLAELLIFFMAK
jgi:hypothetical protein